MDRRRRLTGLMLLLGAAVSVPTADAQQLVFGSRLQSFFDALYTNVGHGELDLAPVYAAAGITVSNQVCNPVASRGPKACESVPCPAASTLGLDIKCLREQGSGGDLLVSAPYPVRRLGDYEAEWNAFQFTTLELKLGGRLPLIGLVRTLAIPKQSLSGFFAFKPIEETSDGEAQIDLWRLKANGARACGAVWCFSVHRLDLKLGVQRSKLSEAIVECVERKVHNITGAPQYCVPIYLRGTRGTFVSALVSFRKETMYIDRGLIGAKIFFDVGEGKADFEAVARIVERAFAAAPLTLSTGRDPDAVVGACDNQISQIIANWHETATVRAVLTDIPFSFGDPSGKSQSVNGIRVGLATTLYVNNRNTPDEWRMPTREQSDAFDTAVVANIKSEASRSCIKISSQVREGVTVMSCSSGQW